MSPLPLIETLESGAYSPNDARAPPVSATFATFGPQKIIKFEDTSVLFVTAPPDRSRLDVMYSVTGPEPMISWQFEVSASELITYVPAFSVSARPEHDTLP